MVEQIDKLYNDQNLTQDLYNNTLNNVIQPLPVGNTIPQENVVNVQNISNNDGVEMISQEVINGTINDQSYNQNPQATNVNSNIMNNSMQSSIEPQPSELNVLFEDVAVPTQINDNLFQIVNNSNQVFDGSNQQQQEAVTVNPVLAEFNQAVINQPSINSNPQTETKSVELNQTMLFQNNELREDAIGNTANNNSNLDIFG